MGDDEINLKTVPSLPSNTSVRSRISQFANRHHTVNVR